MRGVQKYLRGVPLDQLQTPKEGYVVYLDHWWVVNDRDEAMFYEPKKGEIYPQCNKDRRITEVLLKNINPPNCRAQYIKVAYVPKRR